MWKYFLMSRKRKILEVIIEKPSTFVHSLMIVSRLRNWKKEYIEHDLRLIEETMRKLKASNKKER